LYDLDELLAFALDLLEFVVVAGVGQEDDAPGCIEQSVLLKRPAMMA